MSGEAWLILPTYNEAENVGRSSRRPARCSRGRPATASACWSSTTAHPTAPASWPTRLAAEHDWVSVLHRTEKGGIGPAYIAGFRHALANGAGYVMEMDSDFSHDPADLARLLAAVYDGADLALGSRYVPGGGVRNWGLLRRVVSEGGSTYARIILGLQVKRPDRRLQVLPPRGARDDLTSTTCARAATPSRSSSPTAPSRPASRWSRCRSCSATASTAEQDVAGGSPPRRCGWCR